MDVWEGWAEARNRDKEISRLTREVRRRKSVNQRCGWVGVPSVVWGMRPQDF